MAVFVSFPNENVAMASTIISVYAIIVASTLPVLVLPPFLNFDPSNSIKSLTSMFVLVIIPVTIFFIHQSIVLQILKHNYIVLFFNWL